MLSRAQAAARETLHSALDGTPPSWDRLVDLAENATVIRDALRVPSKLRGDEQRGPSSAAYALAAGIALYGIPDGLTASTLRRSVQPIDADDVLRAWGGLAVPTDPDQVVQSLLGTPGSGALIKITATGSGRATLGWLVSRPEGLAWIDPELDGGAAVRLMPPQDAVSLLRALPDSSPAMLWVDPQGRPVRATPAPAGPVPGDLGRTDTLDSVLSTDSTDTISTTDTTLTTPDVSRPASPAQAGQAQDNPAKLAVEVSLGLSARETRQLLPWLPQTYTRHRTDLSYEQNCVLVAIALDQTLASGGDVRKLPIEVGGTPGPLRVDRLESWFPGRRLEFAKSLEQIARAMTYDATGAEAQQVRRGIVVVRGAGEAVSHMFNVVSLGRRFAFIDWQSPDGRPKMPAEVAELRFIATTDGVASVEPLVEVSDQDAVLPPMTDPATAVPPEQDRAGYNPAAYAAMPPPPPPQESMRQKAWNLDTWYEQARVHPAYQSQEAARQLRDEFERSNRAIKQELLRRLAVWTSTPWGQVPVVAQGNTGSADDRSLLLSRFYPAVLEVNPEWGSDNCVDCSIALDGWWGGRAGPGQVAADTDRQMLASAQHRLGGTPAYAFRATDDQRVITGSAGVLAEAQRQGAGYRGIVYRSRVGSRGEATAHMFNVRNDEGYVVALDGQKGAFATIDDLLRADPSITSTLVMPVSTSRLPALTTASGAPAAVEMDANSGQYRFPAAPAPVATSAYPPGGGYGNYYVGMAATPAVSLADVDAVPPAIADSAPAAIAGALTRWGQWRDRAKEILDAVRDAPRSSPPRRQSAEAARPVLDRLWETLEGFGGRLDGLSDEAARVELGVLTERYELANELLTELLRDAPVPASVSEPLGDGRILPPVTEAFRPIARAGTAGTAEPVSLGESTQLPAPPSVRMRYVEGQGWVYFGRHEVALGPVASPPDTTGLPVRDRAGALLEAVRSVESRVTETLDRHPTATDANLVWRTAVAGLTSFAERNANAPDDARLADEFRDLLLFLNHAATGIVALDRSARHVLEPLLFAPSAPRTEVTAFPVMVPMLSPPPAAPAPVRSTVDDLTTLALPPRLTDMPAWMQQRIRQGLLPIPFYKHNAMDGAASKVPFGIEIEFVLPARDRIEGEDDIESVSVRQRLARIGQRLYELGLTASPQQQDLPDPTSGKWSFITDGTVDGEIVSPILVDSPETWEQLLQIEGILAEVGATVHIQDPVLIPDRNSPTGFFYSGETIVKKAGSHVHASSRFLSRYAGADGYGRLTGLYHRDREVLYRLAGDPRSSFDHGYDERAPGWDADYPYLTDAQMAIDAHRNKRLGLSFSMVNLLPEDHPEWRLWRGSLLAAVIQTQVKISIGMQLASLDGTEQTWLPTGQANLGQFRSSLGSPPPLNGWKLHLPEGDQQYQALTRLLSTVFTRPADMAQAAALFYLNDWAPGWKTETLPAPAWPGYTPAYVNWPAGRMDVARISQYLESGLPAASPPRAGLTRNAQRVWQVDGVPMGLTELRDGRGTFVLQAGVTPSGPPKWTSYAIPLVLDIEGGSIRVSGRSGGNPYSAPVHTSWLAELVGQFIDHRSTLALTPRGTGRIPQSQVRNLALQRSFGVTPGDVLIPAGYLVDPPAGTGAESWVRFQMYQGRIHVSVDTSSQPAPSGQYPASSGGGGGQSSAGFSAWGPDDFFNLHVRMAEVTFDGVVMPPMPAGRTAVERVWNLVATVDGAVPKVSEILARHPESGDVASLWSRAAETARGFAAGRLPRMNDDGLIMQELQDLRLLLGQSAAAVVRLDESARPVLDPLLSGSGTLPANTVGVAPDGSYVVAHAPAPGREDPYVLTVFGPDGFPRGTVQTFIDEPERFPDDPDPEADHSVDVHVIENISDVPGAVDLTTFYAARISDRRFLQWLDVGNPRLRQTLTEGYGTTLLSVPESTGPELTDLRLDRAAAQDVARRRLETAGWTLPAGDFGTPQSLRPAWAGTDPAGTLRVVTETLDGGVTRSVLGRLADDGTFEVMAPGSDTVVRRLHSWTAPGGGDRWSDAPLSPAEERFYAALGGATGRTAQQVVQDVVASGEPVRADLTLPGFTLYRAVGEDGPVLVRAMVDAQGRVVRARRPMKIDQDQYIRDGDERDLIAELRAAGWTVRVGHRNSVDLAARVLVLHPYHRKAWDTLAEVHRHRDRTPLPGSPATARPAGAAVPPRAPSGPSAARLIRSLRDRWDPYRSVGAHTGGRGALTRRVIGPDYLGVRAPLHRPAAFAGIDFLEMESDQRASFFRQADLARGPLSGQINPVAEPDTVVRSTRRFMPKRDPNGLLKHKRVAIPRIVHSIWMGGPLAADGAQGSFRDYLAEMRARSGFEVVLWTDLTRAQIVDARAAATGTPEQAAIREFAEWADTNGVRLVNVDEVFSAEAPMNLHSLAAAERSRGIPTAFAAGSDLLRVEILYRFGGVYTDSDNRLTGDLGAELSRIVSSPIPVAVGSEPTRSTNAIARPVNNVIVAPAGHAALPAYLSALSGNYTRNAYENRVFALSGAVPDEVPDVVPEYTRENVMIEVVTRSGPSQSVFGPLAEALGLPDRFNLPRVSTGVFSVDFGNTWLPGAARPARHFDQAATEQLVLSVAAGLLYRLHADSGTLNLAEVRGLVESHQDPALIWESVLTFLAEQPEVRAQVRAVTWEMVGQGAPELPPLMLPPSALRLLSPDTRTEEPPGGIRWTRLLNPATAPGVPARAPAGTGDADEPLPARVPVVSDDPGWAAAREGATAVPRRHSWTDPVSRPDPASPGSRYVVDASFDARRLRIGSDTVTDLTVRVWYDGATPAAAAAMHAVAVTGVRYYLNQPALRLPNGDLLHVTVEQATSPEQAHLTVNLLAPGDTRPMDHRNWRTDASPVLVAGEIAHSAGMRDEYLDGTAPHRPHVLGSLMGDPLREPDPAGLTPAEVEELNALPRGGPRDRYLRLLDRIIGELPPPPGDDRPPATAADTGRDEVTPQTVLTAPLTGGQFGALGDWARARVDVSDPAYCEVLLGEVYHRLYAHPTSAFLDRRPAAATVDDSVLGSGALAGMGDWTSWPRLGGDAWATAWSVVRGMRGRSVFARAGRPGAIGHAVVLHHAADGSVWVDNLTAGGGRWRMTSPDDLRDLPTGLDVRAYVTEADGRQSTDPRLVSAPEADSLARLTADPADPRTGLYIGREKEYPFIAVQFVGEVTSRPLIIGRTFSWTVDGRTGDPGFEHHIEEISVPLWAMGGDAIDEYAAESASAQRLLRNLPPYGAQLGDLFAGHPTITVPDYARHIRVTPRLAPDPNGIFRNPADASANQFTVGVRLSGLTRYYSWLVQNSTRHQMEINRALEFGRQLGVQLRQTMPDVPLKAAMQLEGYGTLMFLYSLGLAYAHNFALIDHNFPLAKSWVSSAVRHDPRVVRRGLPAPIRRWLHANQARIIDGFRLAAGPAIELTAGLTAPYMPRYGVPGQVLELGAGSTAGVHDALLNFLDNNPPRRISTRTAYGMSLVQDRLEPNPDDPDDPAVLIEGRDIGNEMMDHYTPPRIGGPTGTLVRANAGPVLMHEERALQFMRAMAGMTRTAVAPPEAPPPGFGPQPVPVPPRQMPMMMPPQQDPFYGYAPPPPPSYDYPPPGPYGQDPSQAGPSDPARLARRFQRGGRGGSGRGAWDHNNQWLITVHSDGPRAPRSRLALTPQAKVDDRRALADAAAQRVTPVLDRFPHARATELWRDAVRQLDEVTDPDAVQAANLSHLLDQAAAALIRLDRTVLPAVAELWSGYPEVSRTLPAPRTIGGWSGAALTGLTAGVRRPVVTVDVAGAPAALDELRRTLSGHEWWQELPIVVASAATAATEGFTGLTEWFRPILIQQLPAAGTSRWRLTDQSGRIVMEDDRLTARLFQAAGGLRGAPYGTSLPPVLAGLLTAATTDDAEAIYRRNTDELHDRGIREALDRLIASATGLTGLPGYQVAVDRLGGIAPTTVLGPPLSAEQFRLLGEAARGRVSPDEPAYCELLLGDVHDRLYLHPTSAFTRGTRPAGVVDDSAIGRGALAAMGDWRSWGRLPGSAWSAAFDMVSAQKGRSAFLRAGLPGRIGHAVFLHHASDGTIWVDNLDRAGNRWQMRDREDHRGLPTGLDVRAYLTEPDGRRIAPEDWPIAPEPESDSLARALTDPIDPRVAGAGVVGREKELPYLALEFPANFVGDRLGTTLVRGATFRYIADEHDSDDYAFHIEEVGKPATPRTPGTHTVGFEAYLQESAAAQDLMRSLPAAGRTLQEIFGADPRFQVPANAAGVRVIPRLTPDPASTHFTSAADVTFNQFTADIRLSGIPQFFTWLRNNSTQGYAEIIRSQVAGSLIAARYAAAHPNTSAKTLLKLEGVMSAMHLVGIALARSQATVDLYANQAAGKLFVISVPRVRRLGMLRAALPQAVRNWLHNNRQRIVSDFATGEAFRLHGSPTPAQLLQMGAGTDEGVVDGLLAFLQSNPARDPRVSASLGVKTTLSALRPNSADPGDPFVPWELRNVGASGDTFREAPWGGRTSQFARANVGRPLMKDSRSVEWMRDVSRLSRTAGAPVNGNGLGNAGVTTVGGNTYFQDDLGEWHRYHEDGSWSWYGTQAPVEPAPVVQDDGYDDSYIEDMGSLSLLSSSSSSSSSRPAGRSPGFYNGPTGIRYYYDGTAWYMMLNDGSTVAISHEPQIFRMELGTSRAPAALNLASSLLGALPAAGMRTVLEALERRLPELRTAAAGERWQAFLQLAADLKPASVTDATLESTNIKVQTALGAYDFARLDFADLAPVDRFVADLLPSPITASTVLAPPLSVPQFGQLADLARTRVSPDEPAYCELLLGEVHDRLYLHPTSAFRDRSVRSRTVDDSVVGRGALAAMGDWRTWPRLPGLAWDAVFDVLRAEKGRSAFVRAGRPGQVGHAVFLHHAADGTIWVDNLDRAGSRWQMRHRHDHGGLPSGLDARAYVTEPDGRQITQISSEMESDSLARALTDPIDPRTGAAGVVGREKEYPFLALEFPDDFAGDPVSTVLVSAGTFELAGDSHFNDVYGYHIEEGSRPATRQAAVNPGMPTLDAYAAESMAAQELLRRVPGEGMTLQEIFGADPRFTVRPGAERVRVIPRLAPNPDPDAEFAHAADVTLNHFTPDIRLSDLTRYYSWLAANSATGYQELTRALVRGSSFARDFAAAHPAASDKEIRQVAGVATTAYLFALGMARASNPNNPPTSLPLPKRFLSTVVRADPALLRGGGLTAAAQTFLHDHHQDFLGIFAGAEAPLLYGQHTPAGILGLGRPGGPTVRDMLLNFLHRNPPRIVSTQQTMGVNRVLGLLPNAADPNDPYVAVEARNVGEAGDSWQIPAYGGRAADIREAAAGDPGAVTVMTEPRAQELMHMLAELSERDHPDGSGAGRTVYGGTEFFQDDLHRWHVNQNGVWSLYGDGATAPAYHEDFLGLTEDAGGMTLLSSSESDSDSEPAPPRQQFVQTGGRHYFRDGNRWYVMSLTTGDYEDSGPPPGFDPQVYPAAVGDPEPTRSSAGVRDTAEAVRSRWTQARDEASTALDELSSRDALTELQTVAARAARTALGTISTGLDIVTGRRGDVSDGAARGILDSLPAVYVDVDRFMAEALGGPSGLPPVSEVFGPPAGVTPATDPAVLMMYGQPSQPPIPHRPRLPPRDAGAGALPRGTVGLAADGSYVVARRPDPARPRQAVFDVFGPDGRPRGTMEARTREGTDWSGAEEPFNSSGVPGALDLTTYHLTARGDKPFFRSLMVSNPKVQRVRAQDYGMTELPVPANSTFREYEHDRVRTNQTARDRLESRGWSLPDRRGRISRPAWTSDDAHWMPLDPATDEPMAVATETLDGNVTRLVSGRYVQNGRAFEVVDPGTGEVVRRLRSWTGADGQLRWTVPPLSAEDVRFYDALARRRGFDSGEDLVRTVVTDGEWVGRDFLLPGFDLYRLPVGNDIVQVRATLDRGGRVVRALRPLAIDGDRFQRDGHLMLRDLAAAGWTVRAGHQNRLSATRRVVEVNPYQHQSRRTVADAHRIRYQQPAGSPFVGLVTVPPPIPAGLLPATPAVSKADLRAVVDGALSRWTDVRTVVAALDTAAGAGMPVPRRQAADAARNALDGVHRGLSDLADLLGTLPEDVAQTRLDLLMLRYGLARELIAQALPDTDTVLPVPAATFRPVDGGRRPYPVDVVTGGVADLAAAVRMSILATTGLPGTSTLAPLLRSATVHRDTGELRVALPLGTVRVKPGAGTPGAAEAAAVGELAARVSAGLGHDPVRQQAERIHWQHAALTAMLAGAPGRERPWSTVPVDRRALETERRQLSALSGELLTPQASPVVHALLSALPTGQSGAGVLTGDQLRELWQVVVTNGDRAAGSTGDRSLAECLALVQDLVRRLHPGDWQGHGVRLARTREEPTPGRNAETWLGDREDWQRFGSWSDLSNRMGTDPNLGARSLAVVLTERAGAPYGHVYAAYHAGDDGVLWINLTDRGAAPRVGAPGELPSDADTYTRAIVIDPDGVVARSMSPAPPASESGSAPLLDPPVSRGYRGGGIEAERTMPMVLPAGVLNDKVLASTMDESIDLLSDTKLLYERDGVYHLTPEEEDEWTISADIVELRSGVLGILPGEENRIQDTDEFWEQLADVEQRFENVDTEPGRPDEDLAGVLDGSSFQMAPGIGDTAIGLPPEGDEGGNHVHLSFGVPTEMLKGFLSDVTDGTWRDSTVTYGTDLGPVPYRTKAGQQEGAEFGAGVAAHLADFLGALGFAFPDRVGTAVEGVTTLLYSHSGGYMDSWTPSRNIPKAHVATLSRHDHRLLWGDLPWWAAFGLSLQADEIRGALGRLYLERNNAFLDRMRQAGADHPELAGITRDNWAEYGTQEKPAVGTYVDAALTGRAMPPPLVWGSTTTFPALDTNGGRVRHGLAILEVRSYGARRVTMPQTRDNFRYLAGGIRSGYAAIAGLDPLRTVPLQDIGGAVTGSPVHAAMFRAVRHAAAGETAESAAQLRAAVQAGITSEQRDTWSSMLVLRARVESAAGNSDFANRIWRIAAAIAQPIARRWLTEDRIGRWRDWAMVGDAIVTGRRIDELRTVLSILERGSHGLRPDQALAVLRESRSQQRSDALGALLSAVTPEGFGLAQSVVRSAAGTPPAERHMADAIGMMLAGDTAGAIALAGSAINALTPNTGAMWAAAMHRLAGSGPAAVVPRGLAAAAVRTWLAARDPRRAHEAQERLREFADAAGPAFGALITGQLTAIQQDPGADARTRGFLAAWQLSALDIGASAYEYLGADDPDARHDLLFSMIGDASDSDGEMRMDDEPELGVRTVQGLWQLTQQVADGGPRDVVIRNTLRAVVAVATGAPVNTLGGYAGMLAQHRAHLGDAVALLNALHGRNPDERVGGAVTGVTQLVRQIAATVGDVQVFRAEVAYTNPPVLPPLPRGLTVADQIAQMRKHVDAATPRVTEVLDRFPHSDAAALWRAAVDALESNGSITDLALLFNQTAAALIRLDRSTIGVLAPLWSGRIAPDRAVPAPRHVGPWTAGDLGPVTAGLNRPVLTVDLSGRTPAAIERLERALREHAWWGEVPIVVTTHSAKATRDEFTALLERMREAGAGEHTGPVVIEQSMKKRTPEEFVLGPSESVWRLWDQNGRLVDADPATSVSELTRALFQKAARLATTPIGTALPPVLAGLLTAGADAEQFHRRYHEQLTDPGVREALDTVIATAPDRDHLAGFRAALSLDATATERLVPATTNLLGVEPPYTGGPVPATFAYDFLAQTGSRIERFAMDGLLFRIVLAGRMSPEFALDLLRASARNKVDRAVVDVFESVADVMALTEEQAAANPHTDPRLKAILARVEKVSSTAREPGTPPPDCVDPVDRTAFVGRLDALRDMLRADGQAARASLIETLTYVLANC
ncbi:hypothetical protein JCM9533A_63420 [Catenuloplanes niger JCM 9533]